MSVIDSDADVQLSGEAVVHLPPSPSRKRGTPPPLPKKPETEVPPKLNNEQEKSEPLESNARLDPPKGEETTAPDQAAEQAATAKPRLHFVAIPSWLISLVMHLFLVLLLAMFTLPALQRETVQPLLASVAETSELETSEDVVVLPPFEVQRHQTVEAPASQTLENENLTELTESAIGTGSTSVAELDAVNVGELSDLFGQDGSGMATIGGPGGSAEFFGVKAGGRRFVFIVDSSNSMRGRKFEDAKRELVYAIKKLSKKQAFYVIFFDSNAQRMFAAGGKEPESRPALATSENLQRLEYWLPLIQNERRTDPYDAVKIAVEMLPDAIYLLSDGQFTDGGQTERYLAKNNIIDDPIDGRRAKVVVHTIGFYSREGEATLQAIAKEYGGTYRFVARP